jgi:hypothetical protein
MASLWEIYDTSSLRYDKTLGRTGGDSGEGPPQFFGWVRTGNLNFLGSAVPGEGNCENWSQTSESGTAVRLPRDWTSPPEAISPWEAATFLCDSHFGAWCVED